MHEVDFAIVVKLDDAWIVDADAFERGQVKSPNPALIQSNGLIAVAPMLRWIKGIRRVVIVETSKAVPRRDCIPVGSLTKDFFHQQEK